jgi:hypothetical protein
MQFTTVRRATSRSAALVLLAALTACTSSNGSQTVPGPAAPAGIATGTEPAATDSRTGPPTANWAGTTQFLQIKSSGEDDGQEYLEVRPAQKKTEGKSVQTVTLGGAWTKVTIGAQAQNVPKRGVTGDADHLTAALTERTASESDRGFDVTFDQDGQVSKVSWVYVSIRERAQATIERWADSTQFLQIKGGRERDGVTYLQVRPAEKNYLGESFETVTIGGPWTEVVFSALGSHVPLRGAPGDGDALRKALADRPAREVDEGFDITFAGNGQVRTVTWLYVPGN